MKHLFRLFAIGFSYIIAVFTLIFIFVNVFISEKTITLSLTNACAAIMLGFASISFTWAKSFDKEKYKWRVDGLNKTASECIMAALLFMFGSLEKYIAITFRHNLNCII